jgi:putative endonuclease
MKKKRMPKPIDRKLLGKLGEEKALAYLVKKGFRLLAQNYRHKRGEIDLVMQDRNTLVFVEVKWRSGSAYGYPEEAIQAGQEEKLRETAEAYQLEQGWDGPVRFDVIAIINNKIEHFQDAIM